MSTAHAIGAVTKVLVNIVDEGLKAANLSGIVGSDVTVSAVSPQRIDLSNATDPNQLNIFFYLAVPNSGGVARTPTHQSGQPPSRLHSNAMAIDRGRQPRQPAQRALASTTSRWTRSAVAWSTGGRPALAFVRTRCNVLGLRRDASSARQTTARTSSRRRSDARSCLVRRGMVMV